MGRPECPAASACSYRPEIHDQGSRPQRCPGPRSGLYAGACPFTAAAGERERVSRRFQAAASVEKQARRLRALETLGLLAKGMDYRDVPADAIGMAAPDLIRIDLGNMETRLVSKAIYTQLLEAGLL